MISNTLVDALGEVGQDTLKLSQLMGDAEVIKNKLGEAESDLAELRPGIAQYDRKLTALTSKIAGLKQQLTGVGNEIVDEYDRLKIAAIDDIESRVLPLLTKAESLDRQVVQMFIDAREALYSRNEVMSDLEQLIRIYDAFGAADLEARKPRTAWGAAWPGGDVAMYEYMMRWLLKFGGGRGPENGEEPLDFFTEN